MKIAVAGTGYVGLSLAVLLAQNNEVTAIDLVQEKVDILKDNPEFRKEIIMYMRKHLRFMDSKFFVNDIIVLLKS